MSQSKINILSTRTIDEALIRNAALKNVFIDVVPFIGTEPLPGMEVGQQIGQLLCEQATVVFTSVNAVEIVAAKLDNQRPDWRIFCIGHATRELCERHFGKDLIIAVANNAIDLAQVVIGARPSAVIFFCGSRRKRELPGLLRERGIMVKEIVVYETILTPQKIAKDYEGILFFSPSAVQSFFDKNQPGPQTILFAIGATTAGTLKKILASAHGGLQNKIIIGDEPQSKALVEKVINYFQPDSIRQ